jgi:methylated-DNA-[protein]-cysteine S-methyltransferase
MEQMYFTRMLQTPAGPLVLGAGERGLSLLEFDRGKFPSTAWTKKIQWTESAAPLAPHVRQIEEYFAGTRREFTMPLDLRGTEFQLKCWRALLRIPYGETCSYADIAREVGCPQGFRAVGMANHDNPIAIIVPCHRVITSTRTLGGYGGGLPVKEFLLKLEGAQWKAAKSSVRKEVPQPLFS